MTPGATLAAERVSVRFGGHLALSEVTVDARPGEITGLIGPNGAGKTTLFNVITGMLGPTTGRVLLDGDDISRLDTYQRARRGIGRTFQRLELFTGLSVRDNVRVAGEIRNTWGLFGARQGRMDVKRETERLLELVGLGAVADREVSEVPTGTARVVEVARALMTGPRVLLLDEPASGQTEDETRTFGAMLRRLAHDDGLTILLVEHDMGLVMDVCDRVHVLDFGQLIAVGTPAQIRDDPAVLDAYLGTATS
jgi:branched-chain amino acid transport system ATP-binding protein